MRPSWGIGVHSGGLGESMTLRTAEIQAVELCLQSELAAESRMHWRKELKESTHIGVPGEWALERVESGLSDCLCKFLTLES